MSEAINVISRTQTIIVDARSGTVSIVNSGPVGPRGPEGPPGPPGTGTASAATNPIQFLGPNETEVLLQLDLSSGDINSELRLKADDLSTGNPAIAYFAGRQFDTTPQFNGAVMGLYNGDGLNGIFAHAFPPENQLNIGVGVGQTAPVFIIFDHDAVNRLVEITPTGAMDLKEQSVPANPATNVARLYSKDVSGVTKLAMKDSAGTETVFDSGGGGGGTFPIQYDDGTSTYDISSNSPDPHGGWSSGFGYMLFDVHDNSDPLASAGIIGLGPGDFQVDANTVSFNTGIASGNFRINNSVGMNLINSGGHTEIVAGNGSLTGRTLTLKASNSGKIIINAHGHDVTIGNTDTANVLMRQYASGADPAAPIRSGADAWGRFYMRDNGAGKMQFCVRFPTGAIQVIATEP